MALLLQGADRAVDTKLVFSEGPVGHAEEATTLRLMLDQGEELGDSLVRRRPKVAGKFVE